MCSRWSTGWRTGKVVDGTRQISIYFASCPSPVPSFVFATAQMIRRHYANVSMSGQ